jgi:glucosamine-6-phosphate deaminase
VSSFTPEELLRWCSVPADKLVDHPDRRIPFRVVETPQDMGRLMAEELVTAIVDAQGEGREFRAILPCGPTGWLRPFAELVNSRRVSLHNLVVFHMDECLDWECKPIPLDHPYNFRGYMEKHFYAPIDAELQVPEANRNWLDVDTYAAVSEELLANPADLVYGGWGQDGHVAYNQARRSVYSPITVAELAASTARIQENNPDTVIALAQRTFGGAYQFVPPMSITLGMQEICAAKRIRLFSDTGAWKQTALRVALFSEPTAEYPLTLLQSHPDAMLTATVETAQHPVGSNPEWDLGV